MQGQREEQSKWVEECECESVLTVSISTTVLNAFSDSPEMGARKLPAAPQTTKSMRPNVSIAFVTARRSASGCRTSACAGIQVRFVAVESSFDVWVRRSRLFFFESSASTPSQTPNEANVLSPHNNCVGTMAHLIIQNIGFIYARIS